MVLIAKRRGNLIGELILIVCLRTYSAWSNFAEPGSIKSAIDWCAKADLAKYI